MAHGARQGRPRVTDERWRPTPAEIRTETTAALATIRRAWPLLHNPTRTAGATRNPPASRPPVRTDTLSLIEEIARDLGFWVRALIEDDTEGDPQGLNLADAMGCARYLTERATFIGEWEYGNRLAMELAEHARDAKAMAWPKRPSILLGQCTNRIGVNGDTTTCGTAVRAHMDNPGNVKCRGCGRTDTIDGWMLTIVADMRPVTIPQLVPLLYKRLGIVISARTLQRMHRAGQLPIPQGGTPETPTFDRRDVFAVMMHRGA